MEWDIDRLMAVRERVRALGEGDNVHALGEEELPAIAERTGMPTEFGNHNFCSAVRNRSASLTVSVGSPRVMGDLDETRRGMVEGLEDTLEEAFAYLEKAPMLSLEMTMGDNRDFAPRCHLLLSAYKGDHSRLALMAHKAFFPAGRGTDPDMYLVDLPEWHENKRAIIVMPEVDLTFVLGSDYYGEVKKGFLRMGMFRAKERGMLGLHAGTKTMTAMRGDGPCRIGMVLFGLTATGKTTHTVHDHGLVEEGEDVRVLQDDVVFLARDGRALGTERGFYIKTDGLRPSDQPLLYEAAKLPETVLENVMVDHRGRVHFQDLTLTANGRGIVPRDSLGELTPTSVDLPPLKRMDRLFMIFITRRNTVLPIISKLTPEQAAGAFMLGESVESSGGDPRRAGESVRVVGTNPFIIGDEVEEGNWFHDLLASHPDKVESFLLNTGGVGEIREEGRLVRRVTRVQIGEVAAIIRGICRDVIEWREEEDFNTRVPVSVPGIDLSHLDPRRCYTDEEVRDMAARLCEERMEYLSRFPTLHPEIVEAYRR